MGRRCHMPRTGGWIELESGIDGFRLLCRKGLSLDFIHIKLMKDGNNRKSDWSMDWYTAKKRMVKGKDSCDLMEFERDAYDKTTKVMADLFDNMTDAERGSFLVGHKTEIGCDVKTIGSKFGQRPEGDGWSFIGTTDSGWEVWSMAPDDYGVRNMKVVATVPNAVKANFWLRWSSRLGRPCVSKDYGILCEHYGGLKDEVIRIMGGIRS